MQLTWIGHATVVLDIAGLRLLTDPMLRRHAGPLRRVGPRPDPEAWADPTAVLISHLHADHASVGSLRMLPASPMLSGSRNERWLSARAGAKVAGASEIGWIPVSRDGVGPVCADPGGGVAIRLVRADHSARPMPHRPNDTHGHLIRSPEGTVWFAGDTSLYDDMAALPGLAGGPIDVALLPIGGWGPRLSPGHMGPAEAVEACRRVGAKAVLPIHFGTFHPRGMELAGLGWMDRPRAEFAERLARECPEVRLLDVDLGGSISV